MLSLIVAYDQNRLIGRNNDLPWHYPEDLKYFKSVTSNRKVVMGRKTFDSIFARLNKPLPMRDNYVITTQKHLDLKEDFENLYIVNDLEHFIKENEHTLEEIFIIGGKSIYEKLLPYCKYLYITHINNAYEGDEFFPSFDEKNYTLLTSKVSGELNFAVYERND